MNFLYTFAAYSTNCFKIPLLTESLIFCINLNRNLQKWISVNSCFEICLSDSFLFSFILFDESYCVWLNLREVFSDVFEDICFDDGVRIGLKMYVWGILLDGIDARLVLISLRDFKGLLFWLFGLASVNTFLGIFVLKVYFRNSSGSSLLLTSIERHFTRKSIALGQKLSLFFCMIVSIF